jgi:hypothetical protein
VECATVSIASACWPNKGDALGRGAVHVFKLRRMLELRAVHRLWRRPAPVIASVSPPLFFRMSYWRQEHFRGLLDVAAAAESAAGYPGYASYCRLRERGLRNDAFAHLREFIREAQHWSLPERARFADWILSFQRSHPQIYDLIPYPLQQDLIEPTCGTGAEQSLCIRFRIAGWGQMRTCVGLWNSTRLNR